MKKIFTLLVATCATLFAFAGEIVLTPAGLTTQTQTDINVTVNGVTLSYYGSLTETDFRVFAAQNGNPTNDLTISYTDKINKVEIIGTSKGGDITSNAGTITTNEGDAVQVGTTVEVSIDGINATSLVISVQKQLRISQIKLTVDGEVSDNGNQGGNGDDNQGDNDQGNTNPSDTLTVAQAIEIAKGAPGNTTYIVKGYVTYSYGYKEQYDNIDLFIADTPDGGEDFELFRAKMIGAEPQVGDLVVGTGKITTFVNKDGKTIYEMAAGCTVEVLVAGEGGGNNGGDDEWGDDWGDTGELTYDWEPTEVTTINKTFTEGGSYEAYADEGIIDFYVEDDTDALDLYFICNSSTGIPAGTYPINDSETENTVYASPGGDDYYDYPSVFLANIEYVEDEYGAGYMWDAYYLVSGTVTVTDEAEGQKIVVAAKSYNGSTINITYIGTIEEWIEDGVENIEMSDSNTRKVLEGGQIVIIRNNTRYNVLGTQLQ